MGPIAHWWPGGGNQPVQTRPESEADGGVDVAAGDVTNGINHGQQGEAEGDRNTKEAQAKGVGGGSVIGKDSGKNRAAAATEHQPEGAEEFGEETS